MSLIVTIGLIFLGLIVILMGIEDREIIPVVIGVIVIIITIGATIIYTPTD